MLQVLTSISKMVLETEQNINSKPIKVLIENFIDSISRDKIILSPRLLSVTENNVKIRTFFLISGLILLIMNSSNSRYVHSNLNLNFLHASLWCCTIHFKPAKATLSMWRQGKCVPNRRKKAGVRKKNSRHFLRIFKTFFKYHTIGGEKSKFKELRQTF